MVQLIKRLDKGTPLSYEEMDSNLDIINNDLETKITTADSSIAIINAIINLCDGVSVDGNTLAKIRILISNLELSKINVSDIINVLTSNDLDKPLSAAQGKQLKDAIDTEITNRINSSSASSNSINNSIIDEIQARTNADNLEINNRITAINIETNARIISDNNEAIIRAAAITNESNIRSAAITSETNARITAISNENINRNAAISNEIAARTAADNALGDRIDKVLSNVDATALNSLSEIVTAFQSTDGSLIDSINTLSTNLNISLSNEITSRIVNDAITLTSAKEYTDSNINSEVLARTSSDANLNLALTTETNRAISVESLIQSALSTEITDRTNSNIAELNARTTAISLEITNRTNAITNEADARTSADALEVTNRSLAISNEAAARTAADILKINTSDIIDNISSTSIVFPLSANQGKVLKDIIDNQSVTLNLSINSEITNRITDMNSEILARSTADTNEITNRNTAINNAISIEVSDRNTAIANETIGRTNADTIETNARIANDNALDARIDDILSNVDATALNSLSELVTAFQLADNNLTTSISNLSSGAISNLNNEITNRTNADIATLASAELYTNSVITTEISNRNLAINTAINIETQNRIDADAADVISRNNAINAAINNEIINRNTADGIVQTNASNDATTKANAAQAAAISASTPIAHVGSSGNSHALVTTSISGFMSASDKSKLDGIASGAQTNLITSVSGRIGNVVLTKSDVGLSNVNNTSDDTKSVNYSNTSGSANVVIGNSQSGTNVANSTTNQGVTVMGLNNGAAMMTFHRPGVFAAQLGIDIDNKLKLGGWSHGQNSWSVVLENGGLYSININGNAGTATNVAFSGITTKPTTLEGYGITNAASLNSNIFNGGQFITELDKGSISSGTVTFNFAGSNVQKLTVTGPLTISLASAPIAGIFGEMIIELVNGGNALVTLPVINWILPTTGKAASSFSSYLTAIGRSPNTLQTNGTDWIYLWTTNGGATINGKVI